MRDVPTEPDEEDAEETGNEGRDNQNTDNADTEVGNPPTASQPTEVQETQNKGTLDTSIESNDKYYEVDMLLKVKWVQGKKHYLVKWRGEYKNTWELEDYITEKPKKRISHS